MPARKQQSLKRRTAPEISTVYRILKSKGFGVQLRGQKLFVYLENRTVTALEVKQAMGRWYRHFNIRQGNDGVYIF